MIVAPQGNQPMYAPQPSVVAYDYGYGKSSNFTAQYDKGLVSDSIEFVRFSQNSEKSPEGAGRRDWSNDSYKFNNLHVDTCDSQERDAAAIIRMVENDLRN